MIRPTLFFVLLLAMAWQNSSAAGSERTNKNAFGIERWGDNTHLLPQYCKDRVKGSQSPEWSKWRSTFGEAYIHIHHYCSGLFAEQKAKSSLNQRERDNWLGSVVSQMNYVSGACDTGCVIYPELHTRWGWALGEQGQTSAAIRHYQLAYKAKQNYAPAYARLSELYLDVNQPDEARKILELGLKASPNSRSLKRRLKKLGSSE